MVRGNFICPSDPHLFALRHYFNSRFYWSTGLFKPGDGREFIFTLAQMSDVAIGLTDLNAAAAD